MKLTTKGRYAVSAMLYLDKFGAKSPVTLADISNSENISLSYLEQLFLKLRKNGLIESVRGPGGGYRLAISASTISVADIMEAAGEKFDFCCQGNTHADGAQCFTHRLWDGLKQVILKYLKSVKLDQLSNPDVDISWCVCIDSKDKLSGDIKL